MQADDIRPAEQLVQAAQLDAIVRGKFTIGHGIVSNDMQSQPLRARDNGAADPPQPDQADRLAGQSP